jgi:hypothetical protein
MSLKGVKPHERWKFTDFRGTQRKLQEGLKNKMVFNDAKSLKSPSERKPCACGNTVMGVGNQYAAIFDGEKAMQFR